MAGEIDRGGCRLGQALPRSDAREESEIEIRPIYETEDCGKEFTPELRAKEEQPRAEILRRARR